MGSSIFGGGTGTVNQTTNTSGTQNNSTSAPSWQVPYQQAAVQNASTLYGQAPGYQPLTYSPLSPTTTMGISSVNGQAAGGIPYANSMMSTGGGVLSPALNGAAAAGASLYGNATTNQTPTNIANAAMYANNPYTQGMINNANQPILNQLNDVSIPGLNISASGSGNTDSSRAGTAEAIMRNNAGIDMSNNAANILGTQYNNGLNLSANINTANNNALLGDIGAETGVANTGGNLITAGNNMGVSDAGVPISTGQILQGDQNNQNQVNYQNFLAGAQYPWQMAQNYYGMAAPALGSNTSGSSTGTNVTNGTQTQPGPGILGGTLGLATGIGSFFAPTGAFGTGPSLATSIGKFFS